MGRGERTLHRHMDDDGVRIQAHLHEGHGLGAAIALAGIGKAKEDDMTYEVMDHDAPSGDIKDTPAMVIDSRLSEMEKEGRAEYVGFVEFDGRDGDGFRVADPAGDNRQWVGIIVTLGGSVIVHDFNGVQIGEESDAIRILDALAACQTPGVQEEEPCIC